MKRYKTKVQYITAQEFTFGLEQGVSNSYETIVKSSTGVPSKIHLGYEQNWEYALAQKGFSPENFRPFLLNPNGTFSFINKGDYIVVDVHGNKSVYSPEAFNNSFEECE